MANPNPNPKQVCTQWCPPANQPRNPYLHLELVDHMPTQAVWRPGSG